MNSLKLILCLFLIGIQFITMATDFSLNAFNYYKTVVLIKVTERGETEVKVEIEDVILDSTNIFKANEFVTLTHPNWRHSHWNVGDFGVAALDMINGDWHIGVLVTEDEDGRCHFQNNYAQTDVSVLEFSEGLKLLLTCFDIRQFNNRNPSDTIAIKVSEEELKAAYAKNAYFRFHFRYPDLFQLFSGPISFGFWSEYPRIHADIIALETKDGHVQYVPGEKNELNPNAPSFVLRFKKMNADSLIIEEYLLNYDPKTNETRKFYTFKPNKPTEELAKITFGEFTYDESYPLQGSRMDFHFTYRFNDFYTPSKFPVRLTTLLSSYGFVFADHWQTGLFEQYASNGDTLLGTIRDGMLEDELTIRTASMIYRLSYKNGQLNGMSKGFRQDNENKYFEINYERGMRNGACTIYSYNNFVFAKGKCVNNRRTEEWIEYHHGTEKMASIKNYGSPIDESIDSSTNLNDSTPHVQLLSNWCISQHEIGAFKGYCYYYNEHGKLISKQLWDGRNLLYREDWYPSYGLDTATLSKSDRYRSNSINFIEISSEHAQGEYKNNKPWSGTFLVGSLPITHSPRMPPYELAIDTYVSGVCINSRVFYRSPNYRDFMSTPQKKDKRKNKKKS